MSLRIAVVGGGVIGAATARALAGRGATVTVFDPDPTRAAAQVAAGMLAAVSETHEHTEPLVAVARCAARGWKSWASELEAETGIAVGYAATGSVLAAYDRDDRGLIDHHGEVLTASGLPAERLGARALRRLEPALGPSVAGGWSVPDDHQVDPRRVCDALAVALEGRGVRHEATAVQAVTADSVTTSQGSVAVDAVVVCAGWATASLLDAVPVRPVKGQILRLRSTSSAVLPTRVVRGSDVYLVPRPSLEDAPDERGAELVVGATVEDRGDDRRPTAGGVRQLLRDAHRLVPGIDEAELVDVGVGLRPASPDDLPILDTLAGVHVATGHYRNGILLAPWTADTVAAAVLDGAWPDAAAPFSMKRFSTTPSSPATSAAGRGATTHTSRA